MAILGYNTKGGTQTTMGTRKFVSKFTLATAQTLTELHGWFSGGTGSDGVSIVCYADSAGSPGARMAYTNSLALTGADVELSQTGFTVALAPGDYWLGWCSEILSGGFALFDDPGAPQVYKGASAGGGVFPPSDPFGATDASGTREYSCWAVTIPPVTFVPSITVIIV